MTGQRPFVQRAAGQQADIGRPGKRIGIPLALPDVHHGRQASAKSRRDRAFVHRHIVDGIGIEHTQKASPMR